MRFGVPGSFLLASAVSVAAIPGGVGAQDSDPDAPIPAIERRIPPAGTYELPADVAKELRGRTDEAKDRVWEIDFKEHAGDVGALVKAVDFALEHGEFYDEKHVDLARSMLDLAGERHREIDEDETHSWTEQRGLVIRGFRSGIDDSWQPYGLEIPEALDLSKPVPMLVWLHGRGDKITDLHFLERCRTKSQALGGFVKDQDEVIILHPFGRHCVGWKHAGEIDVFEAIAAVSEDYPVDPDRIALAGFSMGGAGAWHIGAHYRDRFCAVHAGAGFAETREYNGLVPENFPPPIEQTLWQVYDVPDYIRNFLNGPVLAYSGAEDKQKQAADLVARELATVRHELRHVIGEGMGHKYNEESVAEIWEWLRECWREGRDTDPERVTWQTPTLRYPGHAWLQLQGLEKHWTPAVVEARRDDAGRKFAISAENVSALAIRAGVGGDLGGYSVQVNGQELPAASPGFPVEALSLVKREGAWTWGEPGAMRKRPGIQGPIDDAFLGRFVVVPPDLPPENGRFARWVEFELEHFRSRWKALLRGELPVVEAGDLDSDDITEANLVLWGDPESNPMIAEIADRLPVEWTDSGFTLGGKAYPAGEFAPVFIFPNPINPDRYVVINSGHTFREGHDRTNSLQNPKLPDWAVIGLDQLPDEIAPGRIEAAGFFDEGWKISGDPASETEGR